MNASLLAISYLIGSITFILGLKMLSHPDTAKRGNLIAAGGMTLAIFATIFLYEEDGDRLHNYAWIFAGLLVGTIVGAIAARRVKMTAMPEMVSLFNGMGGACAMLISILEFRHIVSHSTQWTSEGGSSTLYLIANNVSHLHILIIIAGLVIGSVSFAGSMIAWGKLNGKVKDWTFKGQQYVNLILLGLLLIGSAVYVYYTPAAITDPGVGGFTLSDGTVGSLALNDNHIYFFYAIAALSLLYGVMFVFPIGGADMPVVISLLNSFTGVAAACGGFLYGNSTLR